MISKLKTVDNNILVYQEPICYISLGSKISEVSNNVGT